MAKDLTVVMENRPGKLAELGEATGRGGVNIEGLCAMVGDGKGFIHILVEDAAAARKALEEAGIDVAAPPDEYGPFSLADRHAVISMLEGAGWRDAAWTPHCVSLLIGGGQDPAAAAASSMQLGPTRVATADLEPAALESVQRAIAACYADHLDEAGDVVLGATVGIVTATR